MAYLLSNISAKNYWNRTTIVEIIVGVWVVSFLRHSIVLFQVRDQTHTCISLASSCNPLFPYGFFVTKFHLSTSTAFSRNLRLTDSARQNETLIHVLVSIAWLPHRFTFQTEQAVKHATCAASRQNYYKDRRDAPQARLRRASVF